MTSRRIRLLLALALCAGSLAGCGRKGPLELPPDVAAARAERAQQQQAAAPAKAPAGGQQAGFSQEGEKPAAPKWVEGDRGHRPPENYPFPLDPLLQ